MDDVSRILKAINQGDQLAASDLLPLVYAELRRLAAALLSHTGLGRAGGVGAGDGGGPFPQYRKK